MKPLFYISGYLLLLKLFGLIRFPAIGPFSVERPLDFWAIGLVSGERENGHDYSVLLHGPVVETKNCLKEVDVEISHVISLVRW